MGRNNRQGTAINNLIIKKEISIDASAADVEVDDSYANGFYVGGAGDVEFSYAYAPTTKFVKTFTAGQIWYGDIHTIFTANTTATSLSTFSLT
jgi:hypothetical protein